MTDFEKRPINREITRERFEAIRDQPYGDRNILKYAYGDVASWFTWNKGKDDQPLKVTPPVKEWAQNGHYYDGPIKEWDQKFSSILTTDIVFVGLNMAGDGRPPKDNFIFQNARGHRRIVKTFFGTAAEGAYFTDIIKPDERILENVKDLSEADKVVEFLKGNRNIILNEHIRLFLKELDDIGAVNPLLIVFGRHAKWVLKQGMSDNYLKKRFHAVVYIKHYSLLVRMTDEEYTEDTRNKLKHYITIPEISNIHS